VSVLDLAIGCGVGVLLGWMGGYCHGWLMGTKETERRWADSVRHAEQYREFRPFRRS
jgi:hypothetical protein